MSCEGRRGECFRQVPCEGWVGRSWCRIWRWINPSDVVSGVDGGRVEYRGRVVGYVSVIWITPLGFCVFKVNSNIRLKMICLINNHSIFYQYIGSNK